MKKNKLLYFLPIALISIMMLFNVGTVNAKPPDEWIVANDYTLQWGYPAGGTLQDTWYEGGDTLDFITRDQITYVDFEFGNMRFKQVKLKVAGYGGWFERIDLYIYYTDTTYDRHNGVPEGSVRYYTINFNKVVDYVRISYYSGWFVEGRLEIDFIRLLWSYYT